MLSLVSLWLLKEGLGSYYKAIDAGDFWLAALPTIIATVLSLLLIGVRYEECSRLLAITLRSSTVGLVAYLLFEPPDFTLANLAAEPGLHFLTTAYWPMVAVGLLGLLRPSLVWIAAIYIFSSRLLVRDISGYSISFLDIRYMLDMSIYLSFFGVMAALRNRKDVAARADIQSVIAFVGFGLHLGNYFWSGVAKSVLGPYPGAWLLANQTANVLTYALEHGTLPFGQFPRLTQAVHDGVAFLNLPLNAVILFGQLAAILIVFRLRWFRRGAVFYDILHAGIFVLSGILFWPWIWNNLTLLVAARRDRWQEATQSAQWMCVLTILLGCPSLDLNKSAYLGWWDVADVRRTYFEAVTPSGTFAVPFSFFLSNSYSMSLGYADPRRSAGHYAATAWNAARDDARNLTSGQCPAPPAENPVKPDPPQRAEQRLNMASAFVRAHHARMLRREGEIGRWNYYFRVHHQPSNPFLFEGFNGQPLADIIGYNLVVESVCLGVRNGALTRQVLRRDVDFISVK